ncbi:MAG: hypothetical protein H0U66_04400 [Gemmatimonadaceae bacterium]|nr:hypothetical protein [Gemmatimonadaceae bacterium]
MKLLTSKPRFTEIRIVTVAIALALFGSTPLAAQGMSPQCTQIFGVMEKLWDKPFHMYTVDTAGTDARLHGGKPTVSESVFINGVDYVMVRGKWVKSPIDVLEMRKDMEEKRKTSKATCTHLRDDSVNGESTAVWKVHSETEGGESDNQLWISKSRNVVLRTEIFLDVGGALGKSHMVSNYVYANVQAPSGIK